VVLAPQAADKPIALLARRADEQRGGVEGLE
jgi:hypothetical protein